MPIPILQHAQAPGPEIWLRFPNGLHWSNRGAAAALSSLPMPFLPLFPFAAGAVWMLQCATSRSAPCLRQACCPLHKAPSWARRGRGHCRTAARRGARPAPCQLRAANLLPVGRGIGAAPETRAARTQAEQQLSPRGTRAAPETFCCHTPAAPVGSSHLAGHSSRTSSRLPCMPHTMPGADGSPSPQPPPQAGAASEQPPARPARTGTPGAAPHRRRPRSAAPGDGTRGSGPP